ncbi:MAG: hypothetical protein R3A80_08865 [Bdellovibrionota bacterium]
MTVSKQVRTLSGSFADNISGVGGDNLEYRIQIANAAGADHAPVFDLNVTDALNSKLSLIGFDVDGVDNEGDTLTDGADVDVPLPHVKELLQQDSVEHLALTMIIRVKTHPPTHHLQEQ